jgi:hypothetical protein
MMKRLASTVLPAESVELSRQDVGGISEITIRPDGRVYVLGLSAEMLELLNAAGPWEGMSLDRSQRHQMQGGDRVEEARR